HAGKPRTRPARAQRGRAADSGGAANSVSASRQLVANDCRTHCARSRVLPIAHANARVMPGTLILTNFAIVVIGASSGGVAAMRKLVAKLDPKSPAAYLVAMHVGPYYSRLASILSAAGPLPAEPAQQDGTIVPGRIFVPPPDHHLLLNRDG